MVVTLEVPSEVEARLYTRARARGLSVAEYLVELAERDAAGERSLRGFGAYRHLPRQLAEFERECSTEKHLEDRR
jgi:hypothetical protein